MTGLFLIFFAALALIFFIIGIIDDNEGCGITSIGFLAITLCFLVAIPISRIDSKTNAKYAKVFQETLNANRENAQDMSVFERATIIQEINSCNSNINRWRVKGQKWYNNKWYYHPDTQKVEYIK